MGWRKQEQTVIGDFMGLPEEENKKLVGEIEKNLNTIFGKKPYIVLISVLDDYSINEGKMDASVSGFSLIGNSDLTKEPFSKVSALLSGFTSAYNDFFKNLSVNKGEDK